MIVSAIQHVIENEQSVLLHVIRHGDFAMDLFFIMSSLLLTSSVIGEYHHSCGDRFSVVTLCVNRFLRLAPVYYVLLIVLVVQPTAIPFAHNAWYNFAFLNNLVPFEQQFLNHTWSLALEMQFSIVWTAILALLLTHKYLSLRALQYIAVLSIAMRAASVLVVETQHGIALPWPVHTLDWNDPANVFTPQISSFYSYIYLPLTSRCSAQVFGAIVALALRDKSACQSLPTASNLGVLLCVVSMAACMLPALTSAHNIESILPHWAQVVYLMTARPVFSASGSLLILWMIQQQQQQQQQQRERTNNSTTKWPILICTLSRILGSHVWAPIATISYSGYLTHVPLLGGILLAMHGDQATFNQRTLNTQTAVLIIVACIPLVLLVAFVYHVIVERPLLAIREQLRITTKHQ
jgi:peptidoglycan/LPS O-acetylase OafA/YrhL